ncbi:MAG: hypothetical protein KGZ30_04745 [Anaplasmataceae bacterium]|nr:hypothetical protein [Anaplasmataceae bacterium]
MSYPSIATILKQRGLNLETASEEELKGALWEALRTNLGDGIAYLERLAARVKESGERLIEIEDPNSPLGRQLARLVGTDVSRAVCEEKLGIAFGFYNCCNVVASPTRDALAMSVAEQIGLQNGAIASADC